LSIASNIINIVVLIIQRYSFITTLFLGPSDDVITKFYCILFCELAYPEIKISLISGKCQLRINKSVMHVIDKPITKPHFFS
jgi:restriction endonuclease S subunit